MPIQNWDDPATWDNAYRVKRDDGQPGFVGYTVEGKRHLMSIQNALGVIKALNLNSSHKILMVGAGFGWMAKDISDVIHAKVIASDPSSYIQSRKAQHAEMEVLNLDVTTGNGKSSARKAFGLQGNKKVDFAITENVITCLTDAEAQNLSSHLHDIANTVVHWTAIIDPWKLANGHQDPDYNWKTIADWKVILPSDKFIIASTDKLA